MRICSEYIVRAGWTLVELFEDQGISGAALGNRPGVLTLQEGAVHKLQAGLSGIIGEAFCEMVKDRTYAALESRAKARRR